MLGMFKPIRAIEYQGLVWRNFGRGKPSNCPNCHRKKTWEYIGYVPNYTSGSHAKMYQCSSCEAWVDCVWPKWGLAGNKRQVLVATTL